MTNMDKCGIRVRLYGNGREPGPSSCTQYCTTQACSHPTNIHCMIGYSKPSRQPSRPHASTPSRSQTRALTVKAASDATIMLPAPSDHHMRRATTALQTVSATLGPHSIMVVEVLQALSGRARRNASPLSVDESCENGAQVSCDKCLRAVWGGFEHRGRISNYGAYYGSEEEACGGTFPTFLDRGANDKKDLAFKVEGEDHFVDPTPNRVDHSNLTL